MVKVLVVDDEPGARAMLAMALRTSGVEVETAPDGDAALNMIGQQRFDWVVTDYRMPGLSGTGLVRRVGEVSPDTQVILISAVVDEDAVEGVPVRAFFRKPFDPFVLRNYILAGQE